MASELRITTLANNAGTESVDTTYVINGSAKAWVNFDSTSTLTAWDSFNISSFTDLNTGQHRLSFSNSMNNTGYSHVGGSNVTTARNTYKGYGGVATTYNITTSSFDMFCSSHYHNTSDDGTDNTAFINGDLA